MPEELSTPTSDPVIGDFVCLRCHGGPVCVVLVTEFVLYLRCEQCANGWPMFQRRYRTRRRLPHSTESSQPERRRGADRRKHQPRHEHESS